VKARKSQREVSLRFHKRSYEEKIFRRSCSFGLEEPNGRGQAANKRAREREQPRSGLYVFQPANLSDGFRKQAFTFL